jgi:hypothetical protein
LGFRAKRTNLHEKYDYPDPGGGDFYVDSVEVMALP